jgi:DNA-binding NarL/FixJ family response regulator
MATAIQTISTHPLLTRAVETIVGHIDDPPVRLLPPATCEPDATDQTHSPRLFILDGCSLQRDLGPLAGQYRVRSPGSRFLALLAPTHDNDAEMLRLFYWGIDGFVELHDAWQAELPIAVRRILSGQLWVPAEILSAYAKQAKAVLDAQLLPGHSLTAREGQILHMLMRHQRNKEISNALAISERTVKFHVSNVLTKLNVKDRHSLLPEEFEAAPLPSRSQGSRRLAGDGAVWDLSKRSQPGRS